MATTKLKSLKINNFRALQNLNLELGSQLTVICGRNGTSKSSLLGIAAQIFSFDTDYQKGTRIDHKTILGKSFKSQFSEHFRLSTVHDTPGSVSVDVELFDGYTRKDATGTLTLTLRTVANKVTGKTRVAPRPVVRNNSTADESNNSRNFTHPVIFLSLKRLIPIAERDYNPTTSEYLVKNKSEFTTLTNRILSTTSPNFSITTGTIDSVVAHGDNYDQESVSAGEDNVGQIVLALLSFASLKEQYADYKGGLLLIDEADASLFPSAQIQLVDLLIEIAKKLQLQVILTTHSPTLIQYVHTLSKKMNGRVRTLYLNNANGSVTVKQDLSWLEIEADLNLTPLPASVNKTGKIRVYFEDAEGELFFKSLLTRSGLLSRIKTMQVSLGCGNYLNLIEKGVPEFQTLSIVCFDGDVNNGKIVVLKKKSNIITLPGNLPPELTLFWFLYNLEDNDPIWLNQMSYSKPVFRTTAAKLIAKLGLTSASANETDITDIVEKARRPGEEKLRDISKAWFNHDHFQRFLGLPGKNNPWKRWMHANQESCGQFIEELRAAYRKAFKANFGDDPG